MLVTSGMSSRLLDIIYTEIHHDAIDLLRIHNEHCPYAFYAKHNIIHDSHYDQ